jgi:hypothetical protein
MKDSEEKKELDEFELALKKELKVLQECQKSRDLDSCLKCDRIIGCETRNNYIKAVYKSMNKGVSGGFEF